MLGKRIILIDDEPDICEIVEFNLAKDGFEVQSFGSPITGLEAIFSNPPDLVITDWLLPEMEGLEVCRKIRQDSHTRNLPVIMISCKNADSDLVSALEVGADDYLSKPFSIKELVARIKAVLRRGKNVEVKPKVITVDTMELDLNRKSVTIGDENIMLTRKEFEILYMLISHKGKYLSRQEILDRIWADDVIVTERNVDVNIARLRKKIGDYGTCIKGRSGYGYCFEN